VTSTAKEIERLAVPARGLDITIYIGKKKASPPGRLTRPFTYVSEGDAA
jgi:hypothetical protein